MNAKPNRDSKGSRFIRYFGPVIQTLKELGGSARSKDVIERVAKLMNVPESEQKKVLKSGVLAFDNQVHWARMYLVWAGLIDGSKRGVWSLTETGWKTGGLSGEEAYALFRQAHAAHKGISSKKISLTEELASEDQTELTIESEEEGPEHEESTLLSQRDTILAHLRRLSPKGFEHFCIRLLLEHGFEGLKPTGGPRDKGIDGVGILRINPFVSFSIVFQCKRYSAETAVTSSMISEFRGSIPNSIDKGIFITTNDFTAAARSIARDTDKKPIELISGDDIFRLMEEKGLGFHKAVNEAFFNDFDLE
jgi:restriction system protein